MLVGNHTTDTVSVQLSDERRSEVRNPHGAGEHRETTQWVVAEGKA